MTRRQGNGIPVPVTNQRPVLAGSSHPGAFTASPRSYLRTVFLDIFSSRATARTLV
jgi:hypothetical protein